MSIRTLMVAIVLILFTALPIQAANKANLVTEVTSNTDLVAKVADKSGISTSAAELAINAVFAEIKASLKAGEEVTIVDFGTFSVFHRAARTGRNPQTGATTRIAAKKVAKFKAGFTLE